MSVTANRVWRQLPNEVREEISKVFWAKAKGVERQYLCAILAKAKSLREVFVRKSSVERLVTWTAGTLTMPDQIVDDLFKEYLLQEHRAVIIRFLDLLKIPHADGMIDENFDYETLKDESVQEAGRTLLATENKIGAELYLNYLAIQGGPWAGVEAVLTAAA